MLYKTAVFLLFAVDPHPPATWLHGLNCTNIPDPKILLAYIVSVDKIVISISVHYLICGSCISMTLV